MGRGVLKRYRRYGKSHFLVMLVGAFKSFFLLDTFHCPRHCRQGRLCFLFSYINNDVGAYVLQCSYCPRDPLSMTRLYHRVMFFKARRPRQCSSRLKAGKILLVQLVSNCVRGPPDTPLYYEITEDPVTSQPKRFVACEGPMTWGNEYHHLNRGIMIRCSLLLLAHCQTMERSYRWNLRHGNQELRSPPGVYGVLRPLEAFRSIYNVIFRYFRFLRHFHRLESFVPDDTP